MTQRLDKLKTDKVRGPNSKLATNGIKAQKQKYIVARIKLGVYSLHVSSFFFTNTTEDAKGLLLSRIIPMVFISATNLSISSFYTLGYLCGLIFTTYFLSLRGM